MVEEARERGQPQERVKAGASFRSRSWRTIAHLLQYCWLHGRKDLRYYVLLAFVALLVGRGLALYLPFLSKQIIDSVSIRHGPQAALLSIPLGIILTYGALRSINAVFGQARILLLQRASEGVYRAISQRAFEHINLLSFSYHVEQPVGGLAKLINRGARRADFLLRTFIFVIVPSIAEFVIVTMLVLASFGTVYASIFMAGGAVHLGFTAAIARRRERVRREWIDADQNSDRLFTDVLVNFENVKAFAREGYEAERYRDALARLEEASLRDHLARAALSIGQSIIYVGVLTLAMAMVALDIASGTQSVGSLVLVMALVSQFYDPVEHLAGGYKDFSEAAIDSENLLSLLALHPGVDTNLVRPR